MSDPTHPADPNDQAAIPHDTELLAARIPRRIIDEIKSIAIREDENRSTIVRRLLRRALDQERRGTDRVANAETRIVR